MGGDIYVGRLDTTHLATWAGAIVLGWLAFAVVSLGRRGVVVTRSIPVVLILGTVAIGWSSVAFTLMHAHPLMQYNDDSTERVWGWWGMLWPLWAFGLPMVGVWLLVAILRRLGAGTLIAPEALAAAAALIAGATTWWSMMMNFPSA